MRKPFTYLATFAFLLFIFLPMVAGLLGVEPVSIENRPLVGWPAATASNLLDRSLYRQVDEYLADHMPLKDRAVQADAWIDFNLLGDSPNPVVSVGSDGWLYYTPTLTEPCADDAQIQRVADNIQDLTAIIEESGRSFRFVVAPDKATIYPDHLGNLRTGCAATNRARLRAQLDRPMLRSAVPLWDSLQADRSTGLLYHATDTHWTDLGAAVGARLIVASLDQSLWNPDDLVYTVTFERTGDLMALMGMSGTEMTSQYVVQRSVDVATEELASGTGAVAAETTSTPTGNDEVFPSRTVMIHDSFGDVLAPLLRPYFSELTTVTGPWVTSLEVPEALFQSSLRDSQVIILETVERMVLSGRFEGDLINRVVAALADDLTTRSIGFADLRDLHDVVIESVNGNLGTTGNDPQFRMPGPLDPAHEQFLVVNLEAASATTLQLFFAQGTDFTEEQSMVLSIPAGRAAYAFDLRTIPSGATIRIDPGTGPGVSVTNLQVVAALDS